MAHYSRAPIKEAIFDVRVSGDPISVWKMDSGLHALQERYPNREEIIGGLPFDLPMNRTASPSFNMGSSLIGVRYVSSDHNKTVQARTDGFSLNSLAPYTTWEDFVSEARQGFEAYVKVRQPQVVTRLGLRYVNQFNWTSQQGEVITLGDFFALSPTWNHASLGNAEGFNLQLAFSYPEIEATLLLTQATIASEDEPGLSLDIDVFCEGLRLDTSDSQELWRRAEQLRDLKNKVFEACLKDPARELIQ
jgi:uncharacterized protein (TIGR04255 family)